MNTSILYFRERNFKKIPGNVDTTEGQYEDYINNQALDALGLKKAETEVKPEVKPAEKAKEEVLPLSEEAAEQETLEQQLVSDDTSLGAADEFFEANLFLIENTMELKDGNSYRYSEINSEMLEEMGYSPEEIGEILKSIC
jgi:Holliday junction resolvasome RuvABC DNA-binding subunit